MNRQAWPALEEYDLHVAAFIFCLDYFLSGNVYEFLPLWVL